MACDKVYGLRKVWIAKTSTTPAWKAIRCTSIEVPKVMPESLEIDETSGYRAATAAVSGALNELTGTITCVLPAGNIASRDDLDILFEGAGFVKAAGKWHPLNTGACEHTFSLYCLDRTEQLAEKLDGCIVTNFEITLNRSDAPQISFSYQAASKVEIWGGVLQTAIEEDDDYMANGDGIRINNGQEICSDIGISVEIVDSTNTETLVLGSWNDNDDNIYFSGTAAANHSIGCKIHPVAPSGAGAMPTGEYLANRNWSFGPVDDDDLSLKLTAASLSVETGMSYGEMVSGARELTEVLVGTLAVTGSATVYVTPETYPVVAQGMVHQNQANWQITLGSYHITIPGLLFTEMPDLSLAKDEAATGDIQYKAIIPSGGSIESMIQIG